MTELWHLYSEGKQTYAQLAEHFNCSPKTIQRSIDRVHITKRTEFSSVAVVEMDTTYWKRNFGVMVFRNSLDGVVLYKQYVRSETNALYLAGIEEIRRRGIYIQGIVCDGRQGLFKLFYDVPIQMCQFHQIQIVQRYLTRKPKTQAAIELKRLTLQLTKQTEKEFTNALNTWYLQWKDYLNERSSSPLTGKTFYTHKRLRSAYSSLKRHLPYLFVFEQYKELMIPNTTNALEGLFANLKSKLRNHNGLSKEHKIKFIDGFFKA
ncbi:MAG: transposase [Lentimicrobiaceae bacterium]|nr:transposase [Lentimicrobiaceae bacterium]